MDNSQALNSAINVLILGSVVAIGSNISTASAAPPVQSDNSGGNIFNYNGSPPEFTPEVIEETQLLLSELKEATSSCSDSKIKALNTPRRFARGLVEVDADCITNECQTLTLVVKKAQKFLNENKVYRRRSQAW